MKSEMCKKCIHTNVCFKDKNVCGDVFVPGNPMIFDNSELYRKYEEWEKQGFPCNDYFPCSCKDAPTVDAVKVAHGHWVYKWNPYFKQTLPFCSVCETVSPSVRETDYCPHCGAKMDLLDDDTKWEVTENGVKVKKYNCTAEEIEEVKAIFGEKVTE